jgi:hypothetical protein
MSLMDLFHGPKLKEEINRLKAENTRLKNENIKIRDINKRLKEHFIRIGGKDVATIQSKIQKLNSEISDIQLKKNAILKDIGLLETEYLDKRGKLESDLLLRKKELDKRFNETEEWKIERLRQIPTEIENAEKELSGQKNQLLQEIQLAYNELTEKRKEILDVDEQLLLESYALYAPKYPFQNSAQYKKVLDMIREQQKQLLKTDSAAKGNQNWRVNNDLKEGQKMVKDTIKLVIRSFNNECDDIVSHVTFANLNNSEKRIDSSYNSLNRLGKVMQVTISEHYKKLKIDELYLAHEYQEKKQQEKEEQKRIREELREQQKVEQEIRAAREKIEKEKLHYQNAMEEIKIKIAASIDETQTLELNNKLKDLESKRQDLDKEEKIIDYREQNAKAGYIYVISNYGAFGENIYKIGMTRRLDPMDRVFELGSASVPFPFDVHTMIFSDNAPELEAKIHQHFSNNRLNKINNRKEFYRADINEIEQVIKENYDKIVEVEKEYFAEQYRKSLVINE